MKSKLTAKTLHELNCLRNTVKQLKSANEYHKNKIHAYELQIANNRAAEKQSVAIILFLCLLLLWSNVYHFFN